MTWPGSEYIDSIAAERAQLRRDAAEAPGLRRENAALSRQLAGAVEALDLARGTLKRVAEGCEEPAFGAAMCLGAIDHLAAGGQYAEKEGFVQPRWVVGGCYEENRLRLIEGRALGAHEQLTLVEARE
jgi:hypothetical protein